MSNVLTEPCKWAIYQELIKNVRSEATDNARRLTPVTRSRGVWLNGVDKSEVTLNENADNSPKPMSRKSFLEDAEDLIARGATSVSIEGGIDGAYSVFDMNSGDSTPWVADWSILVWTEKDGWLKEPTFEVA